MGGGEGSDGGNTAATAVTLIRYPVSISGSEGQSCDEQDNGRPSGTHVSVITSDFSPYTRKTRKSSCASMRSHHPK